MMPLFKLEKDKEEEFRSSVRRSFRCYYNMENFTKGRKEMDSNHYGWNHWFDGNVGQATVYNANSFGGPELNLKAYFESITNEPEVVVPVVTTGDSDAMDACRKMISNLGVDTGVSDMELQNMLKDLREALGDAADLD